MGNETFKKRQKEAARREKHQKKVARRMERKKEGAQVGNEIEGEDPDIAGIVPGPQPQSL